MEFNLPNNRSASLRLAGKWEKLAQARCEQANERLTPGRAGAYAELLVSDRPVTAYELLDLLERRQGRKIAPLTVYRHLDFLTRVGLVHRLESTQSYLPCDHPEHEHDGQYLLCSECGHADEVESASVERMLKKLADKRGFQPDSTVVEVRGVCGNCAKAATG